VVIPHDLRYFYILWGYVLCDWPRYELSNGYAMGATLQCKKNHQKSSRDIASVENSLNHL